MANHVHNGSDIRESIHRAASKIAHEVSEATEAAMEDAAVALKHSTKELSDRAAKQSRFAARSVRRGLRDHPITWISASVGAGVLLGALLMRRPSSD
jgi:ElaB/YqjD/DUF883 family membrane-anchored ribosome-binding protein